MGKTYISKEPKRGENILSCVKIESTKFQEQAASFSSECNAFMQNVQDASTYVERMNKNINTESADLLVQTINSAAMKIKDSNSSIESSLTSLPSQISAKAEDLDSKLVTYQITEKDVQTT